MMQEGRDWDRLVINRKDTTGEERVIGHTQIRKGGIAKVTGTARDHRRGLPHAVRLLHCGPAHRGPGEGPLPGGAGGRRGG